MTRWLVTFDDAIADAETPEAALEARFDDDSIPFGAAVYVIDLDAIEGTPGCVHMRAGAHRIEEST